MGSTMLDELKRLKDYELGTLCYKYHIIPGHIDETSRPKLERKLIVAILTTRGQERARSMLRQRGITQDNNTSAFIPLERHKEMKRTPLFRPSRHRTAGGRAIINENECESITAYQTLSNINEKDTSQQDIDNSTVILPTLKSASVTLNNTILPPNKSKSYRDVTNDTNCKQNDFELQADGQILECELRTINYLSKEEEVLLSAERNSQEYKKRREAILNSIDRADFGDFVDYHRSGEINSLDRVFSVFSALNRIGPFKQFNCILLCCGISLGVYVIYRKVK